MHFWTWFLSLNWVLNKLTAYWALWKICHSQHLWQCINCTQNTYKIVQSHSFLYSIIVMLTYQYTYFLITFYSCCCGKTDMSYCKNCFVSLPADGYNVFFSKLVNACFPWPSRMWNTIASRCIDKIQQTQSLCFYYFPLSFCSFWQMLLNLFFNVYLLCSLLLHVFSCSYNQYLIKSNSWSHGSVFS